MRSAKLVRGCARLSRGWVDSMISRRAPFAQQQHERGRDEAKLRGASLGRGARGETSKHPTSIIIKPYGSWRACDASSLGAWIDAW